MKKMHILALGSVLSAGLMFALPMTASAADSTTLAAVSAHQTTATQTKAQAKAAAKAKAKADAQAKVDAKAKAKMDAKAKATPAASPMSMPMAASKPATPAAAAPMSHAASKAAAAAAPNSGDIASAKAKGLVWVNLNTKVYHAAGDKEYGVTKNGKFMTEAEAKAAGARLAKH